MPDEFLNISFDDIVSASEQVEDSNEERIMEINSYEKLYLLKPDENGQPSINMDDNAKLSLYKDIVFSGLRRYYIEDLTVRDFRLEGTIPYQIELFGLIIQDNSWGDFLCKVTLLLLDKFPEKRSGLTSFRTQWTKAQIFTETKKSNFKQLTDDLYLNCNHTALHSCWLLQDILDCFAIDKSQIRFLIHRPSTIEPVAIREHIEKIFVLGFKAFLVREHELENTKSEKTVNYIYKYLNPILMTMSKSYNNLFLFDDIATLLGYVNKIKDSIENSFKFEANAKKVLIRCLKYLSEYYKLK